jgi:hypothetical protein
VPAGLGTMGRDELLLAISVAWFFVLLGAAVYIFVI